jgi:glycosyltransferase involved in cell wall biosynthesis
VLPSYYENFGIAVAEAMTAAIPVIVSDRVALSAAVESAEAGWVIPCDRDLLTATLRSALSNGAEQVRRGKNGQEYARTQFGWEAIARQTVEVYQEILRR